MYNFDVETTIVKYQICILIWNDSFVLKYIWQNLTNFIIDK